MAETELVIFMPIFLSSLIISGNYIVKVPKLGMTLSIFFIKSFLQHIIIKPCRFGLLIISQTGHFLSSIISHLYYTSATSYLILIYLSIYCYYF